MTGARYGAISNLADFVRKAQTMKYECIRSIYEANAAVMIGTASGKPPARRSRILGLQRYGPPAKATLQHALKHPRPTQEDTGISPIPSSPP